MSTVSTINTLVPNATIPLGYFDEDNIRFVQWKAGDVLRREFTQNILFSRGDVVRIMERSLVDGRIESIPRMNQRAIMMLTNDFRNHQLDVDKHLKWEAGYVLSQRLYDPLVEISRFDKQRTKLKNRLGVPQVGGTTRFYFT
ncbi:hypothetical protein OAG24_00675 [bacterium]|nr:hypothetical protein [bacterium]